jgi:hypothetical protein
MLVLGLREVVMVHRKLILLQLPNQQGKCIQVTLDEDGIRSDNKVSNFEDTKCKLRGESTVFGVCSFDQLVDELTRQGSAILAQCLERTKFEKPTLQNIAKIVLEEVFSESLDVGES